MATSSDPVAGVVVEQGEAEALRRGQLLGCLRRPPHELNPVELVWSHLKRSLANLAKRDFTELTALVKTRLKRMQYRPGLLDAFLTSTRLDLTPFCSPSLKDRVNSSDATTLAQHAEQAASCQLPLASAPPQVQRYAQQRQHSNALYRVGNDQGQPMAAQPPVREGHNHQQIHQHDHQDHA
jgi:hypothetical protein